MAIPLRKADVRRIFYLWDSNIVVGLINIYGEESVTEEIILMSQSPSLWDFHQNCSRLY